MMLKMRDDASTIKFVKTVEKYPSLYKNDVAEYGGRDAAWTAIAKEFNITEKHCRDRWKNLRCCFVRAQKAGRRNYYLNPHMEFLRPYTKTKDTGHESYFSQYEDDEDEANTLDSTIENPEVIEYTEGADEDPLEQDDNFQLSPAPKAVEKERKSLKRTYQTITKFKQDDSDSGRCEGSVNSACDDDTDLLFFKSLLPDVKELQGKQKRIFKRKVMSLLEELLDEN